MKIHLRSHVHVHFSPICNTSWCNHCCLSLWSQPSPCSQSNSDQKTCQKMKFPLIEAGIKILRWAVLSGDGWAPVLILQYFKLLRRNLRESPSCLHSRFILAQLCDSLLPLLWLYSMLGCLVLLQLFEFYGCKENYFLSLMLPVSKQKKDSWPIYM